MKWINIQDEKPDAWHQHRNVFESDEVLLDCGDFFVVSRYVLKFDENVQKLIFEGFERVEDQEIVEFWAKIER